MIKFKPSNIEPNKDFLILYSEELLEILADIEHERWSGWMKYQFEVQSPEKIAHWKRLMETPYADLPEYSKESDRKEVRKTLGAIFAFLEKHRGSKA